MKTRTYGVAVALLAGLMACTTTTAPDLSGMSFSPEPLHGKVIWHDLITENAEASRRFYGELFGWTFEDADGPDGRDYLIARSGNVYVAGIVSLPRPDDGQRYSRWLPFISVDDVDDAVSRSVAAGGEVAATARNVNLGRVAAVIDPQGAVIGLARSDIGDPDDRTTAAAPGRPMWTELLADDAGKAAQFYQSITSYNAETIERRGGEYTFLESNGVRRAGILKKPADEITPVWLTFFGVEDPVAAAARAEALGGTIILPASADVRDGTMAIVTDPSGAVLVLQEWTI
jgi:predicted enzyme related to lactoylglutathione lyase